MNVPPCNIALFKPYLLIEGLIQFLASQISCRSLALHLQLLLSEHPAHQLLSVGSSFRKRERDLEFFGGSLLSGSFTSFQSNGGFCGTVVGVLTGCDVVVPISQRLRNCTHAATVEDEARGFKGTAEKGFVEAVA